MQQKSGASKSENKGMKKEKDAQMDMGGGEDMRSQEHMRTSGKPDAMSGRAGVGFGAEGAVRRPGAPNVELGFGAEGAVRRPGAPNVELGMGQQEPTGASNLEYDLVAEMHEMLEGNAALETYIQDARQAGDDEAERCFQQIHDQNKKSVATLRHILVQRLSKAA